MLKQKRELGRIFGKKRCFLKRFFFGEEQQKPVDFKVLNQAHLEALAQMATFDKKINQIKLILEC